MEDDVVVEVEHRGGGDVAEGQVAGAQEAEVGFAADDRRAVDELGDVERAVAAGVVDDDDLGDAGEGVAQAAEALHRQRELVAQDEDDGDVRGGAVRDREVERRAAVAGQGTVGLADEGAAGVGLRQVEAAWNRFLQGQPGFEAHQQEVFEDVGEVAGRHVAGDAGVAGVEGEIDAFEGERGSCTPYSMKWWKPLVKWPLRTASATSG